MRLLLTLLLLTTPPALARGPLEALLLEYETGPAAIFRNDGRYGPTGTPSTAADLNQDRTLLQAHRLAAEARLGERHGLILLYAPFDVVTRATLPRDLDFRGTLFPEGTVVDSRYAFDGYRASYLFRLLQGAVEWDVGASLQVRNALVGLTAVDGRRHALESDVGLVPALKTRLRVHFPWRLWAALEADGVSSFGLGEAGGGLYDVALTLGLPLGSGDAAAAFTRLRLYGGGADVPGRDISTWGTYGFALVGLQVDLVSLLQDGLKL